MELINTFYTMAREHKLVKGFRFDRGYQKGAGNDVYPLVWLDDPVSGRSTANGRVLAGTYNVDFLGIPKKPSEVETVQAAAYITGLSFVERLRTKYGLTVESFTYVSLRDYYDDNAAGYRFTYNITFANPADLCAEYFDENKQFEPRKFLPSFEVDDATGCAVFTDKKVLPSFSLK